jgi:hypothetical protein
VKRFAPYAVVPFVVLVSSCATNTSVQPLCREPYDSASILILEAQSVPSATQLPCIAELPLGWRFSGSYIDDTRSTLWLDHDRAGIRAVEVTLTEKCDISSAVEVPPGPDEVGMRIYQDPVSLDPFIGSRIAVFEGGCIVARYRFAEGSEPALVIEADRAISTIARRDLVAGVNAELDLTLCGAGAPPCPG